MGCMALLYSCEEPKEPQTPEKPVETTVNFEIEKLSVPVEGERSVVLAVSPAEKAEEVEYSVTDEEVVELSSVDVDTENGTVTYKLKGISLGTSTLVAVVDDKVAQCALSVEPVAVERIILDRETLDLEILETYTLGAVVEPENATNPSIEWSSDNNSVATVSRGVVTGTGEGTTVITAAVGPVTATCTVTVHIVEAETIDLDVTEKEIVEGETFIVTAAVFPENATYKVAAWSLTDDSVASYELIDVKEGDNIVAARVLGLASGTTVLKATCGDAAAECVITVVPKEEPVKDPEIGDYFYSDGTWSTGAEAPVGGKTVIGIVYSTDASRISDAEKAMGFTHGLVMAAKTAHAPGAVMTKYSQDSDFDVVPARKLGTSWYADINGYGWTQAILGAYPGERIQRCPAFDWTTTDFSPSAPANTSGWYVPSIGQLWDMMANLGGDEVAENFRTLQTYSYDITWYGAIDLSYNPIEKLNSWLDKVPDEDKELFVTTTDRGAQGKICDIMSSTLYENTGDGAVCIFWLYDTGKIEPTTDWTDQMMICRPILSF